MSMKDLSSLIDGVDTSCVPSMAWHVCRLLLLNQSYLGFILR